MAVDPGDADFVSSLDEASKKKAKEELNELNDKDRELAVQTLRKWVLEQDWLRSPTDFKFLLRFMRVRKFSQLTARQTIEKYWTGRTNTPEWFLNLDTADPEVHRLIRTGVMLCPKVYDKQGRRVCFIRSDFDWTQFKKKETMNYLYRTCCLLFDWLTLDENVQVHGVIFVADYHGMGIDVLKIWNPEFEKKLMQFLQKSLPLRFKGCHMYSIPPFFDAMWSLLAPFMSQKFRDRMFMHGKSLVKIYDELGMECFPSEYLPDDYSGPSAGSIKDIEDEMISELTEPGMRNYLLELSSGKFGVDSEKRKSAEQAPVASFRKLNVD